MKLNHQSIKLNGGSQTDSSPHVDACQAAAGASMAGADALVVAFNQVESAFSTGAPKLGATWIGARAWMTRDVVEVEVGPEAIRAARTSWRRRQIVEAATRLMEEHGFHDMLVSALAREAGISVGTIYQYVENKEGILLAILEDVLDAYASEVPAAMAGLADPVDRLAAGFLSYCRVVDAHRMAAVLAYRESHSLGRDALQRVIALEVATTGLLTAELEAGCAAGVFRPHDTELVGWNLTMLAHMWALKHRHLGAYRDVDAYGRAQLSTVLLGLVVDAQRERYAPVLDVPGSQAEPLGVAQSIGGAR